MTQQQVADAAGIFQPTPPARTETPLGPLPLPVQLFQPTPPARTETWNRYSNKIYIFISTHSAREDGDAPRAKAVTHEKLFQPTPPARTETNAVSPSCLYFIISTHSAREDGDETNPSSCPTTNISTHSAREDGDCGFTASQSIVP